MNRFLFYLKKKTEAERMETFYLVTILVTVGFVFRAIYLKNYEQGTVLLSLFFLMIGCFIGSKVRRDTERKVK